MVSQQFQYRRDEEYIYGLWIKVLSFRKEKDNIIMICLKCFVNVLLLWDMIKSFIYVCFKLFKESPFQICAIYLNNVWPIQNDSRGSNDRSRRGNNLQWISVQKHNNWKVTYYDVFVYINYCLLEESSRSIVELGNSVKIRRCGMSAYNYLNIVFYF